MNSKSKRKPMQVQSILFDRDLYTLAQAKAWLKEHGFKTSVDTTDNTYRFRQQSPSKFKVIRTKTFTKGIKATVGR